MWDNISNGMTDFFQGANGNFYNNGLPVGQTAARLQAQNNYLNSLANYNNMNNARGAITNYNNALQGVTALAPSQYSVYNYTNGLANPKYINVSTVSPSTLKANGINPILNGQTTPTFVAPNGSAVDPSLALNAAPSAMNKAGQVGAGLFKLGGDIFSLYNGWQGIQGNREALKTMKQNRNFAAEDQAYKRAERQRLNQQRAALTASYNR